MKLYDLIQLDCPSFIFDMFHEELRVLRATNHPNNHIFDNIESTINDYKCFNVLTQGDAVVGFSGLHDLYYTDTARALTRTYFSPSFREKGIVTKNGQNFITLINEYFLPYQALLAKQLGHDSVFFSIEHISRRKSLINIVDRFNKSGDLKDAGHEWIVEDKMVNTCRTVNDDGLYIGVNPSITCWQNIATIYFNDADLALPSITQNEWKSKFPNIKNFMDSKK